ncbi:MAG: 50S ribosomal protein L21 [Candidatus Paceibacterota bacterium]|jgi:large subunit ribosomal protein L21
MIAVIKTGGKQYKVSPSDKLKIEKIEGEEGSKVIFDSVLMVSSKDAKEVVVGEPLIKGAKVEAKILKQGRHDKVTVVKHKAKKRYNRNGSHRQPYTEIEIEKITK